MLTLLLTVELSYVLAANISGMPSVYMARLIARTRRLAAEAAGEYWRWMQALAGEGDDPLQPSYRVLPRFGNDD